MPETRNFIILSSDTGKTGGLFTGKDPRSAAKKAATKIFAESPRRRVVHFKIRETGTDVASSYKATLHKLKEPLIIIRGDSQIKISRKIEIEFVAREHIKA